MIRKEIPHNFNQLQTALIGFANDLTLKINQIHDNIPVYLQQAGDISYVIRDKFEDTATQDIIQKTPRVVFNIDDIQYQQDQMTQQYNKWLYKHWNPISSEEEVWQAVGRRVPVNIIITVDFVSPNFIDYLQNFEVMSFLVAKDNVFTYEWSGLTLQSAWVLQSPSMERPGMDMGGATRNWSLKVTFDLQVHLLIPDINSFIRWKDTFIDNVHFDINQDVDLTINVDTVKQESKVTSNTLKSGEIKPNVYKSNGSVNEKIVFDLQIEHSNELQEFDDIGKYLDTYTGQLSPFWYSVLIKVPIGQSITVMENLTSKEIQTHIKNLNMLGARCFVI